MRVLLGTQLAEGPVVKQFEKEFAHRFHLKDPVALNSGTSALELAYELAGIGPGDEVIVPVLTCTATNLPLVRRGAKLVFADIDPMTLNMSMRDVAFKMTEKTKAIVFVDFGGNGQGSAEMALYAKNRGIKFIEDAAQSVGGSRWAWGHGDYICISLQAIKTLTAGDGGFLVCKDPADTKRARMLRWFGYDREEKQRLGDTDLTFPGYKYHMNDISAAIGLGNLRALGSVLRKRSKVRRWYEEEYKRTQLRNPHYFDAPFARLLLYPWLAILVHPKARSVDALLSSHGIGSGPYHYRNDKYSVFGATKKFIDDQCSCTENVGRPDVPQMDAAEYGYTLLPFHHGLSRKDVRRIVELVARALYRPGV